MRRMNLVVGVDRETSSGDLLRFRIGTADMDSISWLSSPVTVDADHLIRRLQAGEVFRALHVYGISGQLVLKPDPQGRARIVALEADARESHLDDLPPC